MTTGNTIHNDLKIARELVYEKCGFSLTNLKLNSESVEYGACSFDLNGHKIEHRTSKITPTKTGQFVSIWKRNKIGVTIPFDILDDFDFMVVTSKSGGNIGQFIFPKSALANRGIITKKGIDGKRGIRVYPPWDIAENKQAEKTQSWQTKYFVRIGIDNFTDLDLTKKLFERTDEN